jgi:two-component system sensor histidine kinase CreC
MSLRLRLALFLVAVFCVGGWLLVRTVLAEVKPRYLESMEESMVDSSRLLAALLETQLRGDTPDPEPLRTAFAATRSREFVAQVYSMRKTQIDLRVYVTDATGRVVFDSDNGRDEGADYSHWRDVRLTLAGEYGARATQSIPATTSRLCSTSPPRSGGATASWVCCRSASPRARSTPWWLLPSGESSTARSAAGSSCCWRCWWRPTG